MPILASSLDCRGNALVNVVVEQLSAAPASPFTGQLYIDSTQNALRYYLGDWQSVATQAGVQRLMDLQVFKAPVRVATTAPLGATYTHATGVLDATSNGALVIDGVTLADGDRVLVKDQTSANENGIYQVTDKGSPTTPWQLRRAGDADAAVEMAPGTMVTVQQGDTQAALTYVMTNASFTGLGATSSPSTDVMWSLVNASTYLQPGSGIRFNGVEVHFDAKELTSGGSPGAPVYCFGSDSDTGMYSGAADTVSWSVGGTREMHLTSAGLELRTPLAATYGGTGLGSYTVGSLLYADTSASLRQLPPASMDDTLKIDALGFPRWTKTRHSQGITKAASVTVSHGLGTEDVLVVVRDANGFVELATTKVVDPNTVELFFTSGIGDPCTVVVVAP